MSSSTTTSNLPLLRCARYWLSNASSANDSLGFQLLYEDCKTNGEACDRQSSAEIAGPGLTRNEGARERDEALDRNVFGAGRGFEARGFQQRRRIEAKRPQTLAQHFAALAECGFGHPFERAPFAGEGLFARHQVHQG